MLERRVHSEEEEEEGEGGLEIDLDYNDYVSVSLTEEEEEVEEPLDLRVGRQPIKEERLLASVPLSSHSPEEVGKGTLLTEKDVISLIDPYIGWDRKRAVCTVCDIKFVKREKARAHVENKHLDCLQYKCPLCRASKYDLEFVTFLRGMLSIGGGEEQLSWHRALAPAEWLDREQGIFKINNRQEFATSWYTFKGLDHVSWESLYSSVITSFRERNILKQLSTDELVFQVFCIKQLLK